MLTVACGITSTPTPTTTHTVTSGKATTITLDYDIADQALILMPGGPYASKRIDVDHDVQLIEASTHIVYAIVDRPGYQPGSDLLIIDFGQTTPTLLTQYPLASAVNNLQRLGTTLLLGTKNNGLIALDISEPYNVKPKAHFNHDQTIIDIQLSQHQVYALSDRHQVLIFNHTNHNPPSTLQFEKALHIAGKTNSIAVNNNRLYVAGPGTGLRVFDLQNPSRPVDRHPLQGQGNHMRIVNDTLYVADGAGGLVILDISNPDRIKWVGSHNKLDNILKTAMLDQHLAVLDDSKRIATLNISRLSLPITGSFYKPANPLRDIASHQNKIYIATGSHIEQVLVPSTPQRQISNEGINQGGTRRAFIHNNIAYVADWFSGLHLYDISLPHFPRHLANYHTPGSSKGVVVKGKYAFVGDDDRGLQIIDISNPREPKWVSELLSTGLAYTLKMVDDIIYLADHRGGLHIIDVSNIMQPSIIGSFDTPGKSWAVDVVNDIAYIADDTSGLLIIDVSNPKQPQQIAQFNPHGYAEDVLIKNNIAYVSFFDKGLYLIDVSNPRKPRQISQVDIPGNARSITLSDDYAFIAGWESGLQIVDISNITAPTIVSNYDTNGSAWGVDVYQGYAYVWDWWGGVKVIDVNDPLYPRPAGKYHTRGTIQQLKIKDNYIYTANGGGGVQVFDIRNALNPIWVTGADLPGEVHDIWPSTNLAYSANGDNGVAIFDISNPFYIKQLGHIDTPGAAYLVREHQQTTYIADTKTGLLVFDVRKPTHPIPLAQYPMTINDLWLSEGSLFVATAKRGLLRFKQHSDGTLTTQRLFDQQRDIQQVRSNADYVFASVNNVGVYILQDTPSLTPPTSPQRLSVVALLPLPGHINDIQVTRDTLYVATASQGLLAIDIRNPAAPYINTRYPATDDLGPFAINQEAAFFAGSHTIASVSFLPALTQHRVSKTKVQLTLPEDLPLGYYHLSNSAGPASGQLWPNAINVIRARTKKPKLTQEDFKKLLKKHKNKPTPETMTHE